MRYRYVGVNRQQEKVSGVVEAIDEIEAKMRIRALQVRPHSLTVLGDRVSKASFNFSLSKPIDLKGMVIFTRQFSSLIDSGVPIVQCLDILQQQEKRVAFKAILQKVKSDIEAGSGLAEALSKYTSVFNEFFIRLVEAGEVSGTLDKSLKRAGLQLEKLGKLRSKVVKALMYPIITLVVALAVMIFLLVKVIPEVSKLYKDSSAQLPEVTQFVLALSAWVQSYWVFLVLGLVGSVFGTLFSYRVEKVQRVVDPLLLRIPVLGSLIKKSAIARFTRTMATLVQSGVPLLTGFGICLRIIQNLAIRDVVAASMSGVQEGKSIVHGLSKGGFFPPMVLHMISIGEMTGKLDDLLAKVADIYDDEVDDAVDAMTGLLQPMLIVGVGGIVAFLLLSMYLPIFQLAEKATGG
ncbi:MAG: type II secretion system F family protein [Deltaproteobacteria bacterium]|nr:type II secretion system F family protein [Deltaproteobacteria bacterium]